MKNLDWRAARLVLLVAALTLGVGACEIVFDPEDSEIRDLERARDRWRREGPSDYSYDFEMYCFCGADLHRTVTIRVRNGAVYDVVYRDDGSPVPSQYLGFYRTIDGLFERVGHAINERADDIDVEYDRRYGYPRSAYIDYRRRAADDEINFWVLRFRPGRF